MSLRPVLQLRPLLARLVEVCRNPRVRLLLKVAGVLVVLVLMGLGTTLAVLWPRCDGESCPSVAALEEYTPPQASRVFDRSGKMLAHLAPERRIVLPLAQIPKHVRQAFLAVEDSRFYQHGGVDYRRVAGALVRNLRTLSYEEGFSTLTMQLARNVFPEQLTRAKTLRRKVWEVVLARDIERAFTKDRILELYLNQIALGEGLHGVEAAAQGYFGKPAARLSLAEAALLAGLPRAPSFYNPRRNPEAAKQRRNLILGLMAREGLITAEEAQKAQAEPLSLIPPLEARGEAPYFVVAVHKELVERFGPDATTVGLRVHTGLDLELQHAAEAQLLRQLEAVEKGKLGRFAHRSCAKGTAQDDASACLQGLYVALEPRTGDVLALVGGRDYALSQFDRVTQARRQAGSVFKPVVYASALAAGIPVSTLLTGPGAAPATEPGPEEEDAEEAYRPADHVSEEEILDLRTSLASSSNRAAVELGERVGVARVAELARALGLSTPIHELPSTFLGAAEVVPLELVAAYAPFTNGGLSVKPRLIQRVEDATGKVVWEAPVETKPVLSPAVAFLTVSLLQDAVDKGTGAGVRSAGLKASVPAAGKTGTTNDAADAWFIGVTPDLVAGVWLGFDLPQRILPEASGGRLAAPVWGRIAKEYYRTRKVPSAWRAPTDVLSRSIDGRSGRLANPECPPEQVRTEWFVSGTEPLEKCPQHGGGVGGWLRRTFEGVGDLFGAKPSPPR
ncbi:MAG: PBP1A family penicillin-binding protein [Myxococcaceae bacterium]